jgi:hypothetical protein
MTLLEKLRLGFLARTRREKLLTLLFLVVIAAMWLMLFVNRVRAFGPELALIKETASQQAEVLDDRERIAAKYAAAFATLSESPDRPPGKVAYETVDQIVRTSGYNFRIDPPLSERRDQLTFFPINVQILKADFFKLAELFKTITSRLPTVNLAELVISVPDKANPTLLDARFKFVAIEINH